VLETASSQESKADVPAGAKSSESSAPQGKRPEPPRKEEPSQDPQDKQAPDQSGEQPEKNADLGNNKDGAPSKPPTKPFYKRPWLMTGVIAGAVLIILAALAYWWYSRHYEDTDDAFIDGYIVQVSPTKVSGYVVTLPITDNQLVHRGDLLLEIDPRDYQLALDQAKAAEATALGKLQQAEAQMAAADAQAQAAQADVTAAEATARNASVDLERNRNLAPRGAVSLQTLDNAQATATSSSAQVRAYRQRAAAAQSQYDLAKSERKTAAAQLDEARVQVRQAELNLSYTKILAPITGRVTNRTVDLGNYVSPGQALFALVDPDVWVTANFKETQLTEMRVGQPVEVRVDAYPSHRLRAHVDSFQRGSGARFSLLPPENATGNYVKVVQRVPVKIVFDEPAPQDMVLGPGMSVEPRVTVRQR
jgi:membrane fusion protein (multidrug efflux system)